MPPRTTIWVIEPHTKVKHLILGRYLNAWLPMMAKYNGRIIFVDGFAGPGKYKGGEDGSPIIVLKALLDHPRFKDPLQDREIIFSFIEEDTRRADYLGQEVKRLAAARPFPKWLKWEVEPRQFAPVMSEILDDLDKRGSKLAPTFVFVDPFGFSGAPLQVIARIAGHPRCECLITFMFEYINRFLEHPDPKIAAHYDELFGTPRWRTITQIRDPEQRRDGIITLYQEQLTKVARFEYVRTFEMINDGNRTEYFLYFGTHNKLGLSRMKEAMWAADPVTGQVFSDRTASDQIVLIQPQVDLTPLGTTLQGEFRGRTVLIEQIEEFVLLNTPYCERKHLKRATLAKMENEELIEAARPSPDGRKGTYPPGTLIKFR